jgi:uncharacterized protein YjiS (DUF1127 family)
MATITITGRDGLAPLSLRMQLAIGAAAQRLATALILWHERAVERRQLLALGDAALKDFGASRADAAGEGGQPFWRA